MAVASCKVNTAASWNHKNGLPCKITPFTVNSDTLSLRPSLSHQVTPQEASCLHTVYTTPHTEVAYVINGPHVALAVRVKICANWFDQVRSKIGASTTVYLWRRAAQWRRSGGAAAAQWRRCGVVLLLVARLADSVVREWQWQYVRVTIRPHLPTEEESEDVK